MFAVNKDESIAREMKRLENLKTGESYSWPIGDSLQSFIFSGHARSESLDTAWSGKILKHVGISAETFKERDTVGGSRELKPFPMPEKHLIHGIITNDNTLRIVTRPCEGSECKTHSRFPHYIKPDGTYSTAKEIMKVITI